MGNSAFVKITSCQKISFKRDDGTSFLFVNHNRLLKTYDGIIGGKTGFTKKSGRCLVTCAEKDGLSLIAVTLNASDDWNDHIKLYNFGFSNYERVYFDSINIKTPVISGNKTDLLISSKSFSIVLPKSNGQIDIKIYSPRFLFAPIKLNEKIGTVLYLKNGKLIATVPLYAQENVDNINYKFNLFEWIKDLLKGIFK
jgi:D-alanyl-D-alanine carboxypeptidase/D-alanyl-D-alanine carboxypeptidase (penicillin-binding protein 5/6)